MDWHQRLQSVRHELQGDGTSDLQRETGVSVRTWGGHVYRYVAELADQFDHGPLALLVIQHYALVSAIYEWAAINEFDLALDRPAFFAHWGGVYQSPSVGTFQGYPERGAWALANDASLRAFVRSDPRTRERRWAGLRWDEIDRPQIVQGRIPVPEGTYDPDHWVGLAWDRAGEDALDVASDPFFSLIGKVQLSMTCAQEVVELMAREYRGRLPPNWSVGRAAPRPRSPRTRSPSGCWQCTSSATTTRGRCART